MWREALNASYSFLLVGYVLRKETTFFLLSPLLYAFSISGFSSFFLFFLKILDFAGDSQLHLLWSRWSSSQPQGFLCPELFLSPGTRASQFSDLLAACATITDVILFWCVTVWGRVEEVCSSRQAMQVLYTDGPCSAVGQRMMAPEKKTWTSLCPTTAFHRLVVAFVLFDVLCLSVFATSCVGKFWGHRHKEWH